MDTPEIPLESLDAARVAALLGERFSLQVLVDVGVNLSDLDSLFDDEVLEEESAGQARRCTWVDCALLILRRYQSAGIAGKVYRYFKYDICRK